MSATVPCPDCRTPLAVRFPTDGHGRVVEVRDPCGYCERKRAGICQRCHVRPVDGTPGMALHCATCRPLHKRDRAKARRAAERPLKHAGICTRCTKARITGTIGRSLYCDACRRAVRNEKDARRWREDPEYRERKRIRKLAFDQTEAGKARKRAYRKRRILRNPRAVIEETRRANARPERIQARREWAHENQTRYVGPGKKPRCSNRNCRRVIPWDGRGRPMRVCEKCDPVRWRQARRRAERKAERAAAEQSKRAA